MDPPLPSDLPPDVIVTTIIRHFAVSMAATNHLSSFLDENYRRFHLPWRCPASMVSLAAISKMVLSLLFKRAASLTGKQAMMLLLLLLLGSWRSQYSKQHTAS
jgi:hypothetical protein